MLFHELITEDEELPIWAGIIMRGVEAGHKFYFASGANRILGIRTQSPAGGPSIVLHLEHRTRKKNGKLERQTYTIWKNGYSDWTLKKHEDGHRLIMREKLKEESSMPLWVSIVKKGLAAGHNFYYETAGGVSRIYNVPIDEKSIRILMTYLDTGKTHAYTMIRENFNKWTLKKFKDGHKLVKLEEIDESLNEPLVVSQFKKLMNADADVFFKNRGGKTFILSSVKAGESNTGKSAWWFYGPFSKSAIVWKTGDAINKLAIKKDEDGDWILYDRTVKLKESLDEPMIVRLINQRTAKQGAVKVEISPRRGAKLIGWITHEIVPSAALNFAPDGARIFKAVVNKLRGQTEVFWFGQDADSMYTLKKHTEKSGKMYLKVVNREAD